MIYFFFSFSFIFRLVFICLLILNYANCIGQDIDFELFYSYIPQLLVLSIFLGGFTLAGVLIKLQHSRQNYYFLLKKKKIKLDFIIWTKFSSKFGRISFFNLLLSDS